MGELSHSSQKPHRVWQVRGDAQGGEAGEPGEEGDGGGLHARGPDRQVHQLVHHEPEGAWRPWTTCTQWTKTCKPSSVSRPPRRDAPCNFFSKTALLNVIGSPVKAQLLH